MMTTGSTTVYKVHLARAGWSGGISEPGGRIGRGAFQGRVLREGEAPIATAPVADTGRVPRVAKLMALAIKFQEMVRNGVVRDYAELAVLGHVTRARMSQIMDLTLLAPDIQEEVLHLPATTSGRHPLVLHDLRPVLREFDWKRQRQRWQGMGNRNGSGYSGASASRTQMSCGSRERSAESDGNPRRRSCKGSYQIKPEVG